MENNQFEINPDFNDLDNPESFINHIDELKKTEVTSPHDGILQELLEQFEPLDFNSLANPKNDENFKIKIEHYLIISVENILHVATKNRWGLCKNHELIYLYNGQYWSEVKKEIFQNFLGEAAERMGVGQFKARYYNFREPLYRQFITLAYLPNPKVDKSKVLINLQNGTFEISPTGTKLRPFDRSDFIKYQLPFEYNPTAKAPLFMSYLNRVQPDIERQYVLAEYLGYIFIKNGVQGLKLEKALILYGSGHNGKSVFFDVVDALLGRVNISNFSLQNLTEDKGFYRAHIENKLVNYASEINGKLEASIFKQMVSGEPVEACMKYGQPFQMYDYAKLIFNCNELPKDVEHTTAFFRRFLIIPFDVIISDHEKDSELAKKIINKELSGVFNWVLEGLKRILEQKKFSECEAAIQAVEQYKIESNSLKMFLLEYGYKSSPNKHRYLKEIFHEYRAFCNDEGMHPFRKNNFAKHLRNEGINVDRGTGNKTIVYIETDLNNDLPY